MGQALATLQAISKEIYGPRIVDQLENETVLTKRMEKSSSGITEDVGGKYVTFPIKVRRNHGLGYRNELEALMPAGQQGWSSVRVPLRYGYGRVQLSGQAIELVNNNSQAFASAMTEEMNGLKEDIAKDTNRIMWGNGLGVIGTIDTAGATLNTVSVGTDEDAVHWFDLDQQVDILSSDGVTVKASNRKITAVNESTGDVTFDGAGVTVVVGDIITRYGNYGREPQGMTSLIKTSGALFNLDPANEPTWSSIEDNTGGALSESKMIKMCDRLRKKGGRPSVIFADLGSRRAYFNLLTSQRRFTDVKNFEGGFTGLAFNYESDIPVVTDVDAPAGKMWFVKEDTFKIYRKKSWDWEDLDGSIWNRVVGYDAFEAYMKQYWEFAIERRNNNAVMTGITPG